MDGAKQIFDYILSQIETSCLNYAVSKTPYSATILLKCSFAKRFHHSETYPEKQQNCVVDKPSSVKVEKENVSDLNDATVTDLETTIVNQQKIIDSKSKELKDFVKSANDQTFQFCEDLLEGKREKKKMASRNKILEDEIELSRGKSDNLNSEKTKIGLYILVGN